MSQPPRVLPPVSPELRNVELPPQQASSQGQIEVESQLQTPLGYPPNRIQTQPTADRISDQQTLERYHVSHGDSAIQVVTQSDVQSSVSLTMC